MNDESNPFLTAGSDRVYPPFTEEIYREILTEVTIRTADIGRASKVYANLFPPILVGMVQFLNPALMSEKATRPQREQEFRRIVEAAGQLTEASIIGLRHTRWRREKELDTDLEEEFGTDNLDKFNARQE